MPRARVTEQDPNAAHQISLVRVGERTGIKCRCMKHGYIALVAPTVDVMRIYNNPANHNNDVEQFDPNKKPGQKVYHVD